MGSKKRLACDGEFFHALEDIESLYVVLKRKEEVLERPRTDRERTFPGKSLWKSSDERYQGIRDLSTQESRSLGTSCQFER